MDLEEALTLLKGGPDGVKDWNVRRVKGEEIPSFIGAQLSKVHLREANLSEANFRKADLAGANLSGANLSGAQLREAYLNRAHLFGANLSEARLHRADLRRADLGEANLSGADLSGAQLRRTDLSKTRLSGADLRRTDLSGGHFNRTDLSGADLSDCVCRYTAFDNVDLSDVKGLESIRHQGPSTVGVDTITRSQGKIPEVFLRGCGVPEVWIAYIPALIGAMQPIQFSSCFISYSSKNEEFARKLHARMVKEKLRVWFAPEDMRGGRKSIDQIDKAIRDHDKLLLVLSEASMRSDWVKHEVTRAVEREKTEKRQILFPISLVGFQAIREWTAFDFDIGRDLAKVVREYHILDFSKWKDHDAFEAGFANLLRDLKAEDAPSKVDP